MNLKCPPAVGVLDAERSKYVIASCVLGLEMIHSQSCIYRGISDSMLFLDDEGHAQFMDYR